MLWDSELLIFFLFLGGGQVVWDKVSLCNRALAVLELALEFTEICPPLLPECLDSHTAQNHVPRLAPVTPPRQSSVRKCPPPDLPTGQHEEMLSNLRSSHLRWAELESSWQKLPANFLMQLGKYHWTPSALCDIKDLEDSIWKGKGLYVLYLIPCPFNLLS